MHHLHAHAHRPTPASILRASWNSSRVRILGSEAYEYLDQGPIVTPEEKRSKASCCVPIGSAEESTEREPKEFQNQTKAGSQKSGRKETCIEVKQQQWNPTTSGDSNPIQISTLPQDFALSQAISRKKAPQ